MPLPTELDHSVTISREYYQDLLRCRHERYELLAMLEYLVDNYCINLLEPHDRAKALINKAKGLDNADIFHDAEGRN